jgi:hypothetical protein
MWIAFVNNLPEIVVGGFWTLGMIAIGYRIGRWRGPKVKS